MERFIGIDVHTQSCTIAVVGTTGKKLGSHVVPTTGADLLGRIKTIPGDRHVCIEEGAESAWLYELISPHVVEFVVTVPGAVPGSQNDLVDAYALAEMLRTNALKTRVFKSPRRFGGLRAAARAHDALTRDLVRAKNRLKAVFRSRAMNETGTDLYTKKTRDPWIEKLPTAYRFLADLLGREVDALEPLAQRAYEQLLSEGKRHPAVALIQSAPGFGPIRAAQLVAIVVTPERFRTKRQFWSYAGLGVVTKSSANWSRGAGGLVRDPKSQTRGLNQNRNPVLKSIFKGAALQIVTVMTDHPLQAHYAAMVKNGTDENLARLTIARKLAAIVLAMWKSGKEYDSQKLRSDRK